VYQTLTKIMLYKYNSRLQISESVCIHWLLMVCISMSNPTFKLFYRFQTIACTN